MKTPCIRRSKTPSQTRRCFLMDSPQMPFRRSPLEPCKQGGRLGQLRVQSDKRLLAPAATPGNRANFIGSRKYMPLRTPQGNLTAQLRWSVLSHNSISDWILRSYSSFGNAFSVAAEVFSKSCERFSAAMMTTFSSSILRLAFWMALIFWFSISTALYSVSRSLSGVPMVKWRLRISTLICSILSLFLLMLY